MSADIIIAPLNHSHLYVFANEGIEREISEHFSFEVPGAQFMSAFKKRHWDGRIRLFRRPTKTLPAGLILRLEAFAAKRGYSVQNKCPKHRSGWSAFDTEQLISAYPVPHEVRDYQKNGITYALNNQRVVLISPTASGKSLILYYLVRQRMTTGPVLLIVPTISLVSQMVGDWRDYGWVDVDTYVHKITGGVEKDTNKPVVVSTWQSIFRQPTEWFDRYATLFGDEAHTFKAESLQSIMEKMTHCSVRIGVTGTLDDAKSSLFLVEGSFGPPHQVARTADLQTRGHLVPIQIQGHFLQYSKHDRWFVKEHKRKYQDEIEYFVEHKGRMRWLVDFISQLSGNVLVLYTFVEKHGIPLYDAVCAKVGKTRPIYFVSGDVDGEQRERVRALLEAPEHVVLNFGDMTVRLTPTESVLLSSGLEKVAKDITSDDDIDEKWIHKNSGVVRRVEV